LSDSTGEIDRRYVPGLMQDPHDDEDDLEPVEDEYDPFAGYPVDPPPKEGEEGDDRVHKDTDA